jgi:hypothetical protein
MTSTTYREILKLGREEGREEGRAKGRAEGRAEGRALALRKVLERQLRQAFGRLDAATRERIAAAPARDLERWVGRVLAAERLEDVFRVRRGAKTSRGRRRSS